MGEDIHVLPDGKNLLIYKTNQHPDFPQTEINVNEGLTADLPSYQVVADGIAPSVNKNILAIFNRTPKRIRIQSIHCYVKSLGNNNIVVQVGYINALPTGGAAAVLGKHAFDFPNNGTAPNDLVILRDNSPTSAISASPVAGISFGGASFSVNAVGNYNLFMPFRNMSALQLRPNGVEGIVIFVPVASSALGTITTHVGLTLD